MKLIVSDLDGTILRKGEKSLNKNIIKTIENIVEKNVFAVASGRSYIELRRIFGNLADKIYFIASDGALVVYRGETLYEKPIPQNALDGAEYTAHGKYITYVKSNRRMFIRKAMEQYNNHVLQIESDDEPEENIYKISDFAKTEKPHLEKVYSDNDMFEYVAEGVNKGEALKALSERLGITADNCFVFGDNTNDIEMFLYTKNSYAVITAKPSVKKCAEHIAESFETEAMKLI